MSNKSDQSNEPYDEEEVIKKSKVDIQHFEILYNRYFEQIFRFIYRKTEDEMITADLTQSVFMKAMDALPKYEYRNVSFGAWLYKIAFNESMKYFRDTKRQFLSLENEKVRLVMTCDDLDDSEERLSVLTQMIRELDDDEVRILELKYFENKNFKEIAFILDKNESTIKMRMYRSLTKLKDKYDELLKKQQ